MTRGDTDDLLNFSLLLPKMVSKSNFRHGDTKSWRKNTSFERECSLLLRASLPDGWDVGDASASLDARPRVVVAIAAVTLLDAGNISKSLLDAAEGVVFLNDASVWFVSQTVTRSRTNQRTSASFFLVPPGSSLDVLEVAMRASRDALGLLEKTDASI